MDKKTNMRSRSLKSGSYSAAITVFVIALIVVLNLLVNALPAIYTKFDYTEQKLYTLSEQSKNIVKGLEKDVTVYVIAQKENEDAGLMGVLEKYQAFSSRLKVEVKDPAVYPAFASAYTEDVLSDNSVIVVSDQRSRVVPVADMYDLSYNQETGKAQLEAFVGEDMITSAIDYVTTKELPKMYIMTGHGEQAIGSFAGEIQRENISTELLNLSKQEKVPEDADCLLMEAPVNDITEVEAKALTAYLDGGGRFFYVSYFSKNETPNLDAVLESFGVRVAKGFVCEGAGNYYGNYPTLISPSYGEHKIVDPLAQNQLQMMLAAPQHVEILESRPQNVTITPLLRTSSAAYLKKVDANTDMTKVNPAKEAGDETGVMNLAVAVEKGDTQIIIATTYDLFSAESNEQTAGANYDFLLNAIGSLCEHESMVAIRGKQIYSDSLTVTSGHTMIWIFVLMILVPIVCLITGLVIWVRRRKR